MSSVWCAFAENMANETHRHSIIRSASWKVLSRNSSANRSEPNSSSPQNTSVNPSVYNKIRDPGGKGSVSASYVIPGSIPSGVPDAASRRIYHPYRSIRKNQRPRIVPRVHNLDLMRDCVQLHEDSGNVSP